MQGLDLARVRSLTDADSLLEEAIPNKFIRGFALQVSPGQPWPLTFLPSSNCNTKPSSNSNTCR